MDPKLFAFWKYASYPTKQCLGAEIEEFGKNSLIRPKGYGYAFFHPFKICLLEEGELLQKELDKLDKDFNYELEQLKKKYAKLHDDILKVPK